MATGLDGSGEIYFYSVTGGKCSWYRIDLQRLPRLLSPATAEFKFEKGPRWTVVGDNIYCTGGIREPQRHEFYVSRQLYTFNTTKPNSHWKIESCSRKLPRNRPFVFAINRKIYVLGGYIYTPDFRDVDEACKKDLLAQYWGEVYDLDNQTWDVIAPNWAEHGFFSAEAAVLDGETVVFYSFVDASLLFFNTATQKFHYDKHPSLELLTVSHFIKDCHYLSLLKFITSNMKPVVRDSTLYWFSHDLCLYGYDFLHKRWFQSNCLDDDLPWLLPLNPDCILAMPLLLDLGNQDFLVIVSLKRKLLGMASLFVSKGSDSLHVALKFTYNLPVDRPFIPINGISMLKNGEPSSLLGKRKSEVEH